MHLSLHDGTWSSIVQRIGEVADLETTARSFGALRRVRKVRWAEDLLRLALIYGPGHLSLRTTAAIAAGGGIVALSDKGVMGRLRRMGDWLEHLLNRLLEQNRGLDCGDELRLALVDGSLVCRPGSTGNDWRLHARFDPGRGCFGDQVVSRGNIAERVERTSLEAGGVVVQDRGYARVRDFSTVIAAGADFITRIGWNSLRLLGQDGQRFDLLGSLPSTFEPTEYRISIKGVKAPLRLVIQRLPPENAEVS